MSRSSVTEPNSAVRTKKRQFFTLNRPSPFMSSPMINKAATRAHCAPKKSLQSATVKKRKRVAKSRVTQLSLNDHNYSRTVPCTVTEDRQGVEREPLCTVTEDPLGSETVPCPVTDDLPPVHLPYTATEDRNSSKEVSVEYGTHYATLQHALSVYFSTERFSDVTLISQEGRSVKCHKVILCACSEFLDELLTNVTSFHQFQHPVIYLKNVPYVILEAICKFIYLGRADVTERDLNLFITTAESLKIKGLDNMTSSFDDVMEPVDKKKKKKEETQIMVIREITQKPRKTVRKSLKKTTEKHDVSQGPQNTNRDDTIRTMETTRTSDREEENEIKTEPLDIEYDPLIYGLKKEEDSLIPTTELCSRNFEPKIKEEEENNCL